MSAAAATAAAAETKLGIIGPVTAGLVVLL
jgi:hypothetical protein